MNEVQKLLQKQAAWQKSRAKLSWPEKIRLAEAARETVIAFRKIKAAPKPPQPGR